MKTIRILFALLLCGSGHILKNDYFRAFLFFTGFFASIALIYFGIGCEGWLSLLLPLIGISSAVFIWIYSIIDIYTNNEIKYKKSKEDKSLNEDYIKGISFLLKKEYIKSADTFKSILKKNKKDADAIFQLANTYKKMGNEKKAEQMFKLYLRFDNKKWEKESSEYILSGIEK